MIFAGPQERREALRNLKGFAIEFSGRDNGPTLWQVRSDTGIFIADMLAQPYPTLRFLRWQGLLGSSIARDLLDSDPQRSLHHRYKAIFPLHICLRGFIQLQVVPPQKMRESQI